MEIFAARLGLTARGIVYMLMGYLALSIAGGSRTEVDQGGALNKILLRPGGKLLVGIIGLGFACYALWRFYEAAFGVTNEKGGIGPRLISFIRGVIYSSLSLLAFASFGGSRQHQASQEQRFTVAVMSRPGGRLLVALLGLFILAVGIVGLSEGIRLKFMRYFQGERISPIARTWIRRLGSIGISIRGFLFAVVGILLIHTSWTRNAAKATGLDGALKTLRNQPFGGLLLGVVAIGLVIFGIYGLAEARYRHV